MNEGYRQFIGSTENPNLPARGTVQVVALAEPARLDDVYACTLPCAGLTAWFALVERGGVSAGERC